MQEISIRADQEWGEVKDLMAKLRQPRLGQAMSVAVNMTARQVQTRARSLVAKEMGSRVKDISGSIYISPFSTHRTLTATVRASGKAHKLIVWGGKQTPAGVQSKAWGKPKVYKGTFLATMKSGHEGIFRRRGKARLPIDELYGPGVAPTFAQAKIKQALVSMGRERLLANVRRQLDRYTRTRGGRSV